MQLKKHLLVAIFIQFILVCSVFAQSEADIANQRLDKTLTLLQQRDQEIADLKKLVIKLEESKLTPCVVAINSFSDSYLKLPLPSADNSNAENKEIIKLRKQMSEIWKKSVQAQCNWKDSPKWYLEILKYSPIALAILLK
ncbi:MAG TPA: hypothetical protein PKY82_33290 [Pyrinomonadaceae bacterium]|nr:hypothetical protein [Pyrinomonadaceae bacterium]